MKFKKSLSIYFRMIPINGGVFSVKRVSYSVETKYKAVEMKAAGFSTKEIMKELNIRNRTQVKTWWRWYRNGESYRFSQHVGKQYTYGKGLEELSEVEQLKLENKRKDIELDILKKYKALERKWYQQ